MQSRGCKALGTTKMASSTFEEIVALVPKQNMNIDGLLLVNESAYQENPVDKRKTDDDEKQTEKA